MFFVNVWDGMNTTTYRVKADTVCEARMVARKAHQIKAGVDWCEITKVSHKIFLKRG